MIQESSIRKLVNYILLNACSVNSSGLYNGKAGMVLALFEIARYLQDEYIEDQAFDLFQESLITQNEDIGFENGLSGVGYMLLYLIENEFIDADFDELYRENHTKIETGLSLLCESPTKEQLNLHLRTVYYLSLLDKTVTDNGNRVLAESILKETDKLLINKFSVFEKNDTTYSKTDILNSFELYLKVVDFYHFFEPSKELLGKYVNLYRQNKIASSFSIGCYLTNIAKSIVNADIELVGMENKTAAIRNIHRETLSLTQRIDLLYLLNQDASLYKNEIVYLEKDFVEIINENELEKVLLQCIHSADFAAGYQSGIARYLLYRVYRSIENECARGVSFL